jgi:mRNA interferase MazF
LLQIAMAEASLGIGDVITARFPEHQPQGHEQQGYRPAIIVGLPERVGPPRFPLLMVVPLTTYRGQAWAERAPDLYPRLPAQTAGLPSDSIVLLEQLRSLDSERVSRYLGRLSSEAFAPIQDGLAHMLALKGGLDG